MIYLIDGESFTGKTTYIHNYIKNNPDKKCRCFTDEEWTELLVGCLSAPKEGVKSDKAIIEELCNEDVVFIDNIDFLSGKNALQMFSADIIERLCGKVVFFLSGIALEKRIGTILEDFAQKGFDIQRVNYL